MTVTLHETDNKGKDLHFLGSFFFKCQFTKQVWSMKILNLQQSFLVHG